MTQEMVFEHDFGEDKSFLDSERKAIEEMLRKDCELAGHLEMEGKDNYFNDPEYRRALAEVGTIFDSDDDVEEGEDGETVSSFQRRMRKMEDITEGQKLVFKRVIDRGDGPRPPMGSLVIYNYKMFYEYADEPYDATYTRSKPDRQRLGVGTLIEGVEIALSSMKKHERSAFILDHKVMYGELGVQPRIPPKADIYAEIELVDFVERNLIDDFFDKTDEERSEVEYTEIERVVKQCRDDGNGAVRNGRYIPAMQKYMRALDVLYSAPVKTDEEDMKRQKEIVKINLNMAQCCIYLCRAPSCIRYCNEVIAFDPNNIKALYRKGKALIMLGDYDASAEALGKANNLSPNNKDILDCLRDLNLQKSQYNMLQKNMYRKMLNEKEPAAASKKPVIEVDMESEFAKTLRENLKRFKVTDEAKYPGILKAALSQEDTQILRNLVQEMGFWMREVDDSYIVCKK